MKKIWKEYRLEIILLAIVFIGGMILFGPFGLRSVARNILIGATFTAISVGHTVLDSIVNLLLEISLVDLFALLVGLGVIAFVVYRIRERYRQDHEYDATVCPKCGNQIQRIHRTWFDRLIGKTLAPNSRRYRCVDHNCNWSGLRHARARSERFSTDGEATIFN